MSRTNVFVSYSHKDRDWLEKLSLHLAVLERKAFINLWSDTRISIGANWKGDIENALGSARVAILLVSPAFLASGFIWKEEMPHIMKHKKAGMEVLPLIVRPCAWLIEEDIAQLQAYPPEGRPLSTVSDWQADLDLASFVYTLAAKLEKTPGIVATQELDRINRHREDSAQPAETKNYNKQLLPTNGGATSDIPTLSSKFPLGKLPIFWKCLYKSDAQQSGLRMTLTLVTCLGDRRFNGNIHYPERGAITYIEGYVLEGDEIKLDPLLIQLSAVKMLESQTALCFRELDYRKEGNKPIDFSGEYRAVVSENFISGAWFSAGLLVGRLTLDRTDPTKRKSHNPRLHRTAGAAGEA